ncbi:MAG: hypothetical protein ACP5SD_08605 [Elusimicrobiales bacterium]
MKIVLLLFVWCNILHAKDLSYFTIHAGSGDDFTKVHFIVSDSSGRKTGFKSFYYGEGGYRDVNAFVEIPHSNYFVESIGSLDPSVVSNEPESAVFGMESPIVKDTYTIQFIGFDNVKYSAEMYLKDINGKPGESIIYEAYITSGTTQQYSIYLDPTPGAPPPVLTKLVTFQTLRDDIDVAYKLNQIGDDKFIRSLVKMVDIAEKLSQRCEKREYKFKKDPKIKSKCYGPVVAILRMMMKRLEVINKLCDNKTECKVKCKIKTECDEDEAFKGFENKYGRDNDFKEFFEEWDKDEYQIHKKTCKKYITDEALEIITTDINWLIKSLGEEIWNIYQSEHNPYISEKYKSFFK